MDAGGPPFSPSCLVRPAQDRGPRPGRFENEVDGEAHHAPEDEGRQGPVRGGGGHLANRTTLRHLRRLGPTLSPLTTRITPTKTTASTAATTTTTATIATTTAITAATTTTATITATITASTHQVIARSIQAARSNGTFVVDAFADAARTTSIDPDTGPQGGLLGERMPQGWCRAREVRSEVMILVIFTTGTGQLNKI